MNVYKELHFNEYEKVVQCQNSDVGFKAWVAIHNSNLGPALGGCRIWQYDSDDAALTDVLRLSKGMTYKNALARLPLGGGKSVVHTDLKQVDRVVLFEEVGNFIDHLQGKYITAEDVNSTVEDMEIIKRNTQHVATVGASGNPSPFTAYGVYCAIIASVKHKLKRDTLEGLTVAIQGVGETGGRLAEQLAKDKCNLFVADINEENIARLQRKLTFERVGLEDIYDVECDVFAPCALGGTLNTLTIPRLKCKIVAGSANNQLLEEVHGEALRNRGVLYAPDYAANAGGIINVSCEIGQKYSKDRAMQLIIGIEKILLEIFHKADAEQLPTNIVANELAEELFAA